MMREPTDPGDPIFAFEQTQERCKSPELNPEPGKKRNDSNAD
jgi:hypothetical protein